MAYKPVPTGAEILAFLGWPSDDDILAQANVHVSFVIAQVASYTRGRGISNTATQAEPDVNAVVLSATARSLSNPSQATRTEAGSFNEMPGNLSSFSLLETTVLRRYRRTAA